MASTQIELEKRMVGSGRLKRSLKWIYVYALATGAIYTFMGYWDGLFLTACGPFTGVAFGLLMLLVLPIAFVYCELASMMPSCGVELVYGTVCLNKHWGFWSTWLIMAAWLAVPPAGMMGIIQYLNYAFNLQMPIGQIMWIAGGLLAVYCVLNLFEIKIAGWFQTFMLFSALASAAVAAIVFVTSPTWSLSNYVPFFRTAFNGGGALGNGGLWGMAIGMAMLITPYFGFETVPNMVEEGTFPIKDMNKAIWGSVVTCGVFYFIFFLALAGMGPWEALTEGGSFPPFVALKSLAAAYGTSPGWQAYFLFFGITNVLFAIGTCILGFWVSGVRMLYAMGRQNFLPKAFAKTNRHGQPVLANLLILAVSLVALTIMNVSSFLQEFFCLMSFSCAACYAIITAGAIRLAKVHPEWQRPYKIKGGMVTRVIAFVVAIVIAFLCTVGQPGWTQWFLYMGLGAVLWLWMIFVKWRKEAVWMETPEGVKEY